MIDRGSRKWKTAGRGFAVGAVLVALGACKDNSLATNAPSELLCNLDSDLLISSLAPNAIPALKDPTMVLPGDPGADYLFDSDRVVGVVMNGEARAYPHNIMWHHEIINDRIGNQPIAVTLCPLTGSALAFDPSFDGRVLDLGVSGLLFANNLVIYDRASSEVYGPQLSIEGRCGAFRGESLTLMPLQEMSWGRWKELHPDTRVVSGDTGFNRNYRFYPYGNYDNINSDDLLFPMQVDRSRPLKERVLAIRDGDAGRGYPFLELTAVGDVVALNETITGVPTAIFFEARDGQTALAFDARVAGQTLTFDADPAGFWVDRETGSTWDIDGTATGGPMAGERLKTRADAYTLFWFAWRHFQPNGSMFAAPSP